MAKSLPIERYFDEITLEKPTTTTDEWGQPTQTWTPQVILGRLRQLSGREMVMGSKDQIIVSHRLYCVTDEVAEIDRIVHKGRTYHVVRVNDVMDFGRLYQVDVNYDG